MSLGSRFAAARAALSDVALGMLLDRGWVPPEVAQLDMALLHRALRDCEEARRERDAARKEMLEARWELVAAKAEVDRLQPIADSLAKSLASE